VFIGIILLLFVRGRVGEAGRDAGPVEPGADGTHVST
jgi:hypothetical protein